MLPSMSTAVVYDTEHRQSITVSDSDLLFPSRAHPNPAYNIENNTDNLIGKTRLPEKLTLPKNLGSLRSLFSM